LESPPSSSSSFSSRLKACTTITCSIIVIVIRWQLECSPSSSSSHVDLHNVRSFRQSRR
jgi:hypothetical protein